MGEKEKASYNIEGDMKQTTKEEFENFIRNYPRKLKRDCCGISVPSAIFYIDSELADKWPDNTVAYTWTYSDDPDDYFYIPEEKRKYYIMQNYQKVFNSNKQGE